jgi:hypothetical protein
MIPLKPVAALALSFALAACCPKPPLIDITKLPPPLPLSEQVGRLDARTRAIPLLRAKTTVAGVELRYVDKDDREQTQNVDGTLLLRQTPDGNADLRLIGRAFDQEVFQAGRNATDWWFILRFDPKTAWVGDPRRPVDWASLGAPNADGRMSTSILRADLVQDLLALRVLAAPANRNPRGDADALVLRVDNLSPYATLLVESIPANLSAGQVWIKREILINRLTEDVDEVRLYGPSGVLVMRSVLTEYRPATFTGDDNAAKSEPPPRVPYHVQLDFPAQKMRVSLTFETVAIPASINDAAFETPEYQSEGLRVIREGAD